MHTQDAIKRTQAMRDKVTVKAAEMGLNVAAYGTGGGADHYVGWNLLPEAEQIRLRAVINAKLQVCTSWAATRQAARL